MCVLYEGAHTHIAFLTYGKLTMTTIKRKNEDAHTQTRENTLMSKNIDQLHMFTLFVFEHIFSPPFFS